MCSEPWSKQKWKVYTQTRVISRHESLLRIQASQNYKLQFLNVQTHGLLGKAHPVLGGVQTTQEVIRCRVHIKMLAGDYPCQYYIGKDRSQDTACQLCQSVSPSHPSPIEDMTHLLTRCKATADTRTRILPDLLNTIYQHMPSNPILTSPNHSHLAQLILDPTSLNLPTGVRFSPDHPALPIILPMCRNF